MTETILYWKINDNVQFKLIETIMQGQYKCDNFIFYKFIPYNEYTGKLLKSNIVQEMTKPKFFDKNDAYDYAETEDFIIMEYK